MKLVSSLPITARTQYQITESHSMTECHKNKQHSQNNARKKSINQNNFHKAVISFELMLRPSNYQTN
jgi:hypothetical protein